MKKIIINADDFGMSRVFNEVILELLKGDFIKSTSVLVTRDVNNQTDQVGELIGLAKSKDISVGLHFESDRNYTTYKEVAKNIERQKDIFVDLFGFKPSHIDKHKDIYSDEEAVVLFDFARKNEIYTRRYFPNKVENGIITSDRTIFILEKEMGEIEDILSDKKFKSGIIEMIAHPGKFDPDCESSLNKNREKDYKKIIELLPFLEKNHIVVINQKKENF